jgi:hypothetical protein
MSSAAESLAWGDAFRPGGELDRCQPVAPHRHIELVRVGRGLSKMHSEQSPGLDDVDEDGRAGLVFVQALTRAIIEVDEYDAAMIDGKARTGYDWGELCAKPARGQRRFRMLLRLGGKLLHHEVPEAMVLALMLAWNRSMALPPLDNFEVEKVWRWVCERRRTR